MYYNKFKVRDFYFYVPIEEIFEFMRRYPEAQKVETVLDLTEHVVK